MGSTGKGSTGKGKGSAGDSKGKGKRATETTDERKRRATDTTQQLVRLAVPGFPPLEQLKSRVVQLNDRVNEKLGAVPLERRTPPPATIAAPAAFQYALLGESDEVAELRDMFENLLVASMDRNTAASAHPAFVSMISQLTPDEARILRSIDRDDYSLVEVYEFRPERNRELLGSRTRLGIGIGIDETRQEQYIANLERLGIFRIITRSSSDIEGHNALVAALETEFPGRNVRPSDDSIVLTSLGKQFLDTCVRPRR